MPDAVEIPAPVITVSLSADATRSFNICPAFPKEERLPIVDSGNGASERKMAVAVDGSDAILNN